MEIRPTISADRLAVAAFMERKAGSPYQVRKGELLATHELPGFVAEDGTELAGFAGYHFPRSGECELAALFARRGSGIGTKLVEAVLDEARRGGARRLWLITTNDNIETMRVYLRRGFRPATIHPGAVDDSRRTLKPESPRSAASASPSAMRSSSRWCCRPTEVGWIYPASRRTA